MNCGQYEEGTSDTNFVATHLSHGRFSLTVLVNNTPLIKPPNENSCILGYS